MSDSNLVYFFYYGFACLLLAFLVWYDADNHYGNGGMWGLFMFFFWPVLLPVYVFVRLRYARGMSKVERERHAAESERGLCLGGDIYNMQYRKLAERGGGTLYQPPGQGGRGYKHFTDQRAEGLLREGRVEEAWEYLSELYLLAVSDTDPQRRDTYRYYIGLLPQGQVRLARLLAEALPGETPPGPPAAPTTGGVAGRQAPF